MAGEGPDVANTLDGGDLATFLSSQDVDEGDEGDEVPVNEAGGSAADDEEVSDEEAGEQASPEQEEPEDQWAGLEDPAELRRHGRGVTRALAEARRDAAIYQQRLADVWDRVTQAALPRAGEGAAGEGAEPEIPPYEDDPLGHLNGQISALQREIKRLTSGGEQQGQAERVRRAIQAADANVAEYAESVGREAFEATVLGGIERAVGVMVARHPGLTRDEADRQLGNEIQRIKLEALSAGRNPGEAIYQLAQSYLAGAGGNGRPPVNGRTASGRARAGAPPTAGGVRGASPEAAGGIAAKVEKMTDDQFDAALGDLRMEDLDPSKLFGDVAVSVKRGR
jgi:hypothetical protein